MELKLTMLENARLIVALKRFRDELNNLGAQLAIHLSPLQSGAQVDRSPSAVTPPNLLAPQRTDTHVLPRRDLSKAEC